MGAGVNGQAERFRLVVSDIQNFVQCMLATQANHVIHDGKLTKGCFIRLKNYQANEVKGKRILIILDVDVIESLGTMEKIGEPTAVKVEEDVKPHNTTIGGGGFYGTKPQPQQPAAQDRAPHPAMVRPTPRLTPPYILLSHYHRTLINGQSKQELRVNRISEHGTNKTVKASSLASIFWMRVARLRQRASTSSATLYMSFSRKATSIILRVLVEFKLRRSNFPISIMTTSSCSNEIPWWRKPKTKIMSLKYDTTFPTLEIYKQSKKTAQLISSLCSRKLEKPQKLRQRRLINHTAERVDIS
ncbi:f508a358-488b-4ca6-9146-1819018c094a [Sclerotinia trifoliorum]|uniref:F508a358-488b-4ca6-9146-1819018c094a n=1 Tax=Sclerotinia trifoliorum TaxID=28548 RepID=A0A8H2VKE7_9HELO|nr:f508a358-488b-4ca6-9146-1819018c094a [Sclerotinia trifoliorum]